MDNANKSKDMFRFEGDINLAEPYSDVFFADVVWRGGRSKGKTKGSFFS
jgi:hypothetical protein